MAPSFRFKQFQVNDNGCTMKVNTDAVLLGAWADTGNARTILDAGTGCGVIALMLAQRSDASVDAVEIHEESANQAGRNFSGSPWGSRLRIIHDSVVSYARECNIHYDLVVSNPPYFSSSLKPEKGLKSIARHDTSLTLTGLLASVKALLKPDGRFCLILPFSAKEQFGFSAIREGLYPSREVIVFTKPGVPPKRALFEFRQERVQEREVSVLNIFDKPGGYSKEYRELTREFYLDSNMENNT